ncbi:hypothetical protein [Rhodopseudomonas sp.]|uniref:hypothetical protein n=1 Tax=Rhodopseudomonas sp. TaxID=1078 RepID=UPI0039E6F4EB
MTPLEEIMRRIDGLPAAEAAASVRSERERCNQRRLDLIEKASELTRQLAVCETSDKPNPKMAERLRALRDRANEERQAMTDEASVLNALLLDIEGMPIPAASAKPTASINSVN